MAEPTNKELERYTLELERLRQKFGSGEISLDDYSKDLFRLQKKIDFLTTGQTQIDKELGFDVPELYFDVQETLEGENDTRIVQSYAEKEQEKNPEIDIEEAFRRGRQRLQTELPQYATGEFVEPLPAGTAVSDVIDPIRGLIRDSDTGKVRKGSKEELYRESFYRQMIPDPMSTIELEESLSAKYRELYNAVQDPKRFRKATAFFGILPTRKKPLTPKEAEDFVNLVRKQDESKILPDLVPVVPAEVIETDFFGELEVPRPPVTLIETPIMWSFRQLNKPSAIMAETLTPFIQKSMEAVGLGEEPKIRKDSKWYKETQIEGVGGQVITNMLRNQGLLSKQQAQLLPPDSDYDGVFGDLLISETPTSLGAGIALEFAAPATELGLARQLLGVTGKTLKFIGKHAKSKAAQKAGQFVESPFEYIRYEGAKKEVDMALRSITDNTLTSSKIEKEIVQNGGSLNRSSLRDKAASTIGDVYAQHKVMKRAIDEAKIADDEIVKITDFKTPNSPYLRSIFKNQNELRGSTLKYRVGKADDMFSESGALGKQEKVALRGANKLADDVEQKILTGKEPLRNKDLVDRSINKTKILNTRTWDLAFEHIGQNPELFKKWQAGKFIVDKVRKGDRISSDEMITLGNSWDFLDKAHVWDDTFSLNPGLMKSQENIYLSIRYAIEDLMKDKFLKNIPDDYIYVNSNVAVPLKSKTNKVLFGKYANEVANRLDFTPRQEGTKLVYDLFEDAAQKTLQLQKRFGFDLPQSILDKVKSASQGKKSGLSVGEYRILEQHVSGELALSLLDGVRLKEGALTARFAELPEGGLRQTLISAGQTSTSFVPSTKSIVNSLRFIFKGPKVYGTQLSPINSFFSLTDELPAAFQRFDKALTQAHKSSIEIIVERNKPPRGVNPVEHINVQLQKSMDDYVNINSKQPSFREGKELEISPTARTEFVGDIDYRSMYQSSLDDLRLARTKIKEGRLGEQSSKMLDNFERRVQTAEQSLAKTYAKDLQRIVKKYERKQIRAGYKEQDLLKETSSKSVRDRKRVHYTKGFDKQAAQKEVLQNVKQYQETRKLLREAIEAERSALYDDIGKIEDSPKFQKLQEQTNQKIEKLQNKIDEYVNRKELQQVEKSQKAFDTRQLQILADKYGRDNIKQLLADNLGKPVKDIKVDDVIANLDYLQNNMATAQTYIYQRKIWDRAIDSFFVAREGENSLRYNWESNLDKVIRLDNDLPVWSKNNIKPLTIGNFKQVIDDLRNLDNSLRDRGLTRSSTTMTKQEEAIMLPLMKVQIEVERIRLLDNTINTFIKENPDMFISINRMENMTLGLESTIQIADMLTEQFKIFTNRAINAKIDKNKVLDSLFHTIRETLFDGMAKDIWNNTTKQKHEAFFKSYFQNMIQTGQPIISDINKWVVGLYADGTLSSKTFDDVAIKVNNILIKLEDSIDVASLNKEQVKIFKDLKKQFPLIVESMRGQYLKNITLSGDGLTDGLFSQQIANVADYINRYGINNNILVENVKALSPRFDYLGNTHYGLVYGRTNEKMMKQIVDACKYENAPKFMNELESRFAKTRSQRLYPKTFIPDLLKTTRRWGITQLLHGHFTAALKFLGMNRVTATFLMLASLGSSSMSVKSLTQFSGLSLTLGLSKLFPDRIGVGGFSFRTQLQSNRMMYAPADEIILSVKDGALRPYTAGELRKILIEQGANFSRADDTFLDTMFEKMLIDSKLTADGLARYYGLKGGIGQRVYDNLAPSGANMNAELTRFQDTEMRRFVLLNALREGKTVDQAGEMARRSMLDYSSLSDFEKSTLVRQIYFYSFMRTMGAETINSFYRAVTSDNFNPLVRMIRTFDLINQATMERNEGTDMQRSRLYNIFVKTIDGINVYSGGPVNPSISGMDFAARMSLMTLDAFDSMTREEKELEYKVQRAESKLMGAAIYGSEALLKANPFTNLILDGFKKWKTGRSIPFPSELIDQAENEGNLQEVINMYQLAEREPTRGRPLSATGKYYDFKRGTTGFTGYSTYIMHRMLGLTVFADAVSRSTIFGIKNPVTDVVYAPAALTRFHKDHLRAMMLIEEDMKMPSPTGGEDVTIPTRSPYLKTLSGQEKNFFIDSSYAQYMASQLGLHTQMKSQPAILRMEYALKRLQYEIKEIEKKLPQEK